MVNEIVYNRGGGKLEVRRGGRLEVRSEKLDVRRWICFLMILTSTFYFLSSAKAQTLEDYQKMAAEQNPGLQADYKAFEAAMERVAQVKGLPDPTLTVSAFGRMTETRVGPQMARFSLSQMFPWFGTLKAAGDVAALNAEVKYHVFLDSKNKLYYQVASAYYPIYELQKWINLEVKNKEILESYKTIATSRFENDEGSLADVLRTDLMLQDAITNLEILQKKKKSLIITFNTLLNREDSTQVVVADTLSFSELTFDRDSLLDNPVIDELETKLEVSRNAEILASKQGLPMLGVGLDYIIVAERTDLAAGQTVQGNGQDAIMPMVSVGLPIFRGKYKAAIKEAQLMQESYSLQKEDRINQLISDFEQASFNVDQQIDLLQLYVEQIRETQQVLNLLFSAYSNSGKDFEEVLRVQQQLLKYQKMQATALMEYHLAVARLNYLTAKTY